MIVPVLLTLAVTAGGALASYLYDREMPLLARLGIGAASGLAVMTFLAFVLANVVGIALAAPLVLLAAAAVLALLGRTDIRTGVRGDLAAAGAMLRKAFVEPSLSSTGPVVYAVALAALLWLVFERVVIIDDGGIWTGYVNNLGDLPFHMQVTASFAHGQNFPPEDPTYAGTGFAYPYMADFMAAVFISLGANMAEALFIGNLALGLALVAMLHRFAHVLTRDRLAALIAPALVLLSGGLGWTLLLDQARMGEQGLLGLLSTLPHDYTIGVAPYRWGNAITTLLVTQRSLLFGLPLALAAFALLWRLIRRPPVTVGADPAAGAISVRRLSPGAVVTAVRRRPEALAAGVLTGLLPLIHAHSFVVVMATAFFLGLIFRQWRNGRWLPWAVYVVAALVIALPEIWWSTHDSIADAGTFFGFEIGWDRGTENPLWFWFLNTGLFIPIIVLMMLVPYLRSRLPAGLLLFSLPFLLWFVVPNLVKLAPWVWDNIKVLFFWYVGFVPMVALLVAWLLRDRPVVRIVGVVVLASLVLAGSLDVWRVISRQTLYQEFDADAVALGDEIRQRTPPRALILHAPTWNPTVFLTGRRSLLGYTGYIWAHGLEYAPREADIKRIYAGDPEADALIVGYEVDYVVVTPIERAYMDVDDAYFSQFTEVAAAGEYRLYQVAP
jgi:hypothetical protein